MDDRGRPPAADSSKPKIRNLAQAAAAAKRRWGDGGRAWFSEGSKVVGERQPEPMTGRDETVSYGEGSTWDEAFEYADDYMSTPEEIKRLDGLERAASRRPKTRTTASR